MKEIKLTNSTLVALVDDENFDFLNQYKWHIDNIGYARLCTGLRMHEVLMGHEPGKEVDHKNGNKLDNRKENLRHVTHAENLRNRGPNKRNITGYKGVWYSKDRYKWYACIVVNYKTIHLGSYKTIEEAARAYDRAAIKYFGEFAYTNFPRTDYV